MFQQLQYARDVPLESPTGAFGEQQAGFLEDCSFLYFFCLPFGFKFLLPLVSKSWHYRVAGF